MSRYDASQLHLFLGDDLSRFMGLLENYRRGTALVVCEFCNPSDGSVRASFSMGSAGWSSDSFRMVSMVGWWDWVVEPDGPFILNIVVHEGENAKLQALRGKPSFEEIRLALKGLPPGTASGGDGITERMLKLGGECIVLWLYWIFSVIWRVCFVPEAWRRAIIAILPKTGNVDLSLPTSWRGISLLSVPGKVLARILARRLVMIGIGGFVENVQFAYLQGHSTVGATFTLSQTIETARLKKQKLWLCFVDLKAAFDSVPREKLWPMLQERFGLPKQMVQILAALHYRTEACVRAAGGVSDFFGLNQGVRQGCCVAPLLFILFMDAVVGDAIRGMKGVRFVYRGDDSAGTDLGGVELWLAVLLFADDLVLIAEDEAELDRAMQAFSESCAKYGLTINFGKTKSMKAGRIPKDDTDGGMGCLGGWGIAEVDEFKYLGSLITSASSWAAEVKRRIGMAAGVFKALRKPLWRTSTPVETKLRVFQGAVLGVLLYGAECWVLPYALLRKLCGFHDRCLREVVSAGQFDSRPPSVIRNEMAIPPLESTLRMMRLRWFGHLFRMPANSPPVQALKAAAGAAVRNRGGGLTWWRAVRGDLETVMVPLEVAVVDALNADRWRLTARSALMEGLNRQEAAVEDLRGLGPEP